MIVDVTNIGAVKAGFAQKYGLAMPDLDSVELFVLCALLDKELSIDELTKKVRLEKVSVLRKLSTLRSLGYIESKAGKRIRAPRPTKEEMRLKNEARCALVLNSIAYGNNKIKDLEALGDGRTLWKITQKLVREKKIKRVDPHFRILCDWMIVEGLSVIEEVCLQAIEDGATGNTEIAEKTGLIQSTVYSNTCRLIKKGLITKEMTAFVLTGGEK